jgi:hypothetical protein
VCTSLKLLNYLKIFKHLKNTELKILMINPGVVAAIRVVGVRGDPCGEMRWTVQRIAPRTSTTCIAATTPGLIIRILNSVFFKFLKKV